MMITDDGSKCMFRYFLTIFSACHANYYNKYLIIVIQIPMLMPVGYQLLPLTLF